MEMGKRSRQRMRQQARLYGDGPELPPRLAHLAEQPWLKAYRMQLKSEGKSANTLKSYLSGIRKFIETPLPGENILSEAQREGMIISQLLERLDPHNGRIDNWMLSMVDLAPSTINARLASAAHIVNWLGQRWPEHLIRPRNSKRLPRTLTKRELSSVIDAASCSEDPLASLVVTILLETGLRVSELCELSLDNIDLEDRSAMVYGGKGDKDRMVLFTERTVEKIWAWLPVRESRDAGSNRLLISQNGDNLQSRGIQRLMDKLADSADIPRGRLSPHVLRHNFATGLLERGADLVSIQRLLGHASIATTRVYLEISDQTLREVYRRAQSSSSDD